MQQALLVKCHYMDINNCVPLSASLYKASASKTIYTIDTSMSTMHAVPAFYQQGWRREGIGIFHQLKVAAKFDAYSAHCVFLGRKGRENLNKNDERVVL